MPTYTVTGINIGTFNLGESDKLLTIFSAERGLMKAVAKGARKPGAKMTGRSELLNINTLFLSTGRSLDIITQAETVETFPKLREDLVRLTFGLYYCELSQIFGQGLSEESGAYFDYLRQAVRAQADSADDASRLCLKFELGMLDMLGYKPELACCVLCRRALTDFNLAAFHPEWGGILCRNCYEDRSTRRVREDVEQSASGLDQEIRSSTQITPLVWKQLVLASRQEGMYLEAAGRVAGNPVPSHAKNSVHGSVAAARRLMQSYIEHRAGRRLKALDLIRNMS
jgi:DNA repair protein RecO (recombination protein O)